MGRPILPSLLILLLLPLSLSAMARDADVVARMGDSKLSLAEVSPLIDQLPPEARTPEAIDRIARTAIIRKHILAEARRQSFDKKPDINALMSRASEQALVTAYMNMVARPPADYPSESLLRQAYEESKASLTAPPQFRVSQIYVSGTDSKAAKKADDLYRQAIKKNSDFAELARKSSQHPSSAARGGEMGWLTEQDLATNIRETIITLKKGQISKPVAASQGFHILRLDERKEAELLTFEKAKPLLTQNLRLRKARETEAAYLDSLQANSPVAVNGIVLGDFSKAVR